MRKQKSWLTRFSRAARWRLEAKEAEEVIADYREIVGGSLRTEEELIQDLGKPRDAVKPLVDPKAYRVWLAVFLALAACIVLPGTSPLPGGYYRWYWLFVNRPFWVIQLGAVLLVLGAAGAVVWFRRKGSKSEKLPGAVPVLLAVLLVWLVLVLGASWMWLHDPLGFAEMWGKTPVYVLWVRIGPPGYTVYRSVSLLGGALEWAGGLGMTVIGIFALVKARTGDRRWTAVYVLAVTIMLVSLKQLAVLTDMSPHMPRGEWPVLLGYFYRWVTMAAVGLVGTGVALC